MSKKIIEIHPNFEMKKIILELHPEQDKKEIRKYVKEFLQNSGSKLFLDDFEIEIFNNESNTLLIKLIAIK
jgi:hypothetical protein